MHANRQRGQLYEILGVSPDASPEDIKKQYKKLVMQHHPDKGGDSDQFKRISEAFQVLSDKEQRSLYDQLGDDRYTQHKQGGGNDFAAGFSQMPFAFDEIFAGMFGGSERAGRNPAKSHFNHTMEISLDDAYRGVHKRIKVVEDVDCPKCTRHCADCKGTGVQVSLVNMGMLVGQIPTGPCKPCNGTGKVRGGQGSNCAGGCNGKGKKKETHVVDIHVPGGVESGAQMRMTVSSTCEVTIQMNVKPHSAFERVGETLMYRCKLSFQESVLGKKICIPHFDGPINLDTSSLGIIMNKQEKVLTDKGMPKLSQNKKNHCKGDLIIVFEVEPVQARQMPLILPNSIKVAFLDVFNKLDQILKHVEAGGSPSDNLSIT